MDPITLVLAILFGLAAAVDSRFGWAAFLIALLFGRF